MQRMSADGVVDADFLKPVHTCRGPTSTARCSRRLGTLRAADAVAGMADGG